jgi:uncharacterized protein (DUF2225 family)
MVVVCRVLRVVIRTVIANVEVDLRCGGRTLKDDFKKCERDKDPKRRSRKSANEIRILKRGFQKVRTR